MPLAGLVVSTSPPTRNSTFHSRLTLTSNAPDVSVSSVRCT